MKRSPWRKSNTPDAGDDQSSYVGQSRGAGCPYCGRRVGDYPSHRCHARVMRDSTIPSTANDPTDPSKGKNRK